MNLSMNYAQSIQRVRRGMGLLVRSTAFSFSDPVFSAVKRNAYPELELAVGSFPYSSLAPPTTRTRQLLTARIRKRGMIRFNGPERHYGGASLERSRLSGTELPCATKALC